MNTFLSKGRFHCLYLFVCCLYTAPREGGRKIQAGSVSLVLSTILTMFCFISYQDTAPTGDMITKLL